MKNQMKKNTLRAAALSLSAVLTSTSLPLTAFAEDLRNDNDENNSNSSAEVNKTESTEEAINNADKKIKNASEAINDVTKDETNKAQLDAIDSKAIENAGKDTDEAGTEAREVKNDIDNAKDASADYDDAVDKADSAVAATVSANGLANTAIIDADKAANDALEDMDKAASVEDAEAIKAAAEEQIVAANTAYETAETEYNNAKDEYAQAVADMEAAKKAYDEAMAAANTDAAEAKAALEAAEAKVKSLQEAVSAKATELANSAGAKIAAAENEVSGTDDWEKLNEVFKTIISEYYIPEVIGSQVDGKAEIVDIEGPFGYKSPDDKKLMDFADSKNYYIVKYKVTDSEGKSTEYTKYMNYKTEAQLKIVNKKAEELTGNSTGILIFEKEYVKDDEMFYVNRTDNDLYIYNKDYVKEINGKFYYLGKEPSTTAPETYDGVKSNEKTTGSIVNGKYVETTTADFTTTREGQVTSSKGFDSEAEAKADAELKVLAALADGEELAEDAVINVQDNKTDIMSYSAKVAGYKTEKKVFEEHIGNLEPAKGEVTWLSQFGGKDYYIVNVVNEIDTKWYQANKYNVEVAEVTTEKVGYSTFDQLGDAGTEIANWWNSVWNSNSTPTETQVNKLKNALKEKVESEGGIYLSDNFSVFNWSFTTASYSYVKGTTVLDQTYATAAERDAAVEKAMKTSNMTGLTSTKTEEKVGENHSYTYTADYKANTTENKVISTTTYNQLKEVNKQVGYYDNTNWNERILVSEYKDNNLRDLINQGTQDFTQLQNDLDAAKAKVIEAENAVASINIELENLKQNPLVSGLEAKKEAYELDLKNAKDNLDAAKKDLDDLNKKKDTLADKLVDIRDKFKPSNNNGGGNNNNNNNNNASEQVINIAPVANAPMVRALNDLNSVVVIEDEPTPLANTPEEKKVSKKNVVANETEDLDSAAIDEAIAAKKAKTEVVTIEEEDVPLADSVETVEEMVIKAPSLDDINAKEETKMSWWWLIIVAVMGAAGTEMYIKHQQKKKSDK